MLLAKKMLMGGGGGDGSIELTTAAGSVVAYEGLATGIAYGKIESGATFDIEVTAITTAGSGNVTDCIVFVWDKDDGSEVLISGRTDVDTIVSGQLNNLSVGLETPEFLTAVPDNEPFFAVARHNAGVTNAAWTSGDFSVAPTEHADNVSGTPNGATAATTYTFGHEAEEPLEMSCSWGNEVGDACGSMAFFEGDGTVPVIAYEGDNVITATKAISTSTSAKYDHTNFSVGAGFAGRVFVVGVAFKLDSATITGMDVTVKMKEAE